MKKKSASGPMESPRFIYQPHTIDTLAMATERLDSINEDYHQLSVDQNPHLNTHPYEGAVLFTIDERPADRASAILHAPAYGLWNDPRLDFFKDSIERRRVILSQTALGKAIAETVPTFHSSKMNPEQQIIWARPIVDGDTTTGAVQLAYTINQDPEWNYPTNDEVENIWSKHERSMNEVARALSQLALRTGSLSRSLEIAPPVTPNAFIVHWDIQNSAKDALTDRYAQMAAYLEIWKAHRKELTDQLNATVLDRGDGEHIIIPITTDLNDPARVRTFGKRTIPDFVTALTAEHDRVAQSFAPDIFPKMHVGVGIGNIEKGENNNPTGQVLWDVMKLSRAEDYSVAYTEAARNMLF